MHGAERARAFDTASSDARPAAVYADERRAMKSVVTPDF
jgi:hypothetical protein